MIHTATINPFYAQFNDEGRIAKVWVEFIGEDEPRVAEEA